MASRRKPLDTQRLQTLSTAINNKQVDIELAQAEVLLANTTLDRFMNDMETLRHEFKNAVAEYTK